VPEAAIELINVNYETMGFYSDIKYFPNPFPAKESAP